MVTGGGSAGGVGLKSWEVQDEDNFNALRAMTKEETASCHWTDCEVL